MSIKENKFPSTYDKVDLALLIEAYANGYELLKKAIEGLNENDLKDHVIQGKWSIQEIVAHIADSELMGAGRIKQCYTQSYQKLTYYDQDFWSTELKYNNYTNEQLEDTLSLFGALRKSVVHVFYSCDKNDWKKIAYHPETGKVTLRNLLELYADHNERHIEQILERRTLLNQKINIPLLLKERLY